MNLLPKHPDKDKDELGLTLASQYMKLNLEADHGGRGEGEKYLTQLEPPGLDFCH